MSVKIKPTSTIKAQLGLEPNGRVQRFFAATCYRHMDKYVPKQKGLLRRIVTIKPTSITYWQPYAEIQYYGIIHGKEVPESHYTTPGSGPYWDKRMWSADGKTIVKEVQRFIGGK